MIELALNGYTTSSKTLRLGKFAPKRANSPNSGLSSGFSQSEEDDKELFWRHQQGFHHHPHSRAKPVAEPDEIESPEELPRSLQSPGVNSKVYVPILMHLYRVRYSEGCEFIDFTLDDIRETADLLGFPIRNAADLVYRMRSRTVLPPEITDKGFMILKQIGRGKYRLEKGETTIFDIPEGEVLDALDITPLPVRRLLPAELSKIDEQGLLTVRASAH